ncbi:hypothetical protein E2P86_15690 [Sphingobacterium psychroaquaticum]|uniref:hypothetical protein n=1 Tax=Sphingobacterium psychroaquaticum TaxID=561061 RepID=UPI001069ACAB|nr:hypothetical protein [Sphingobacterium psychroaquaticum]QBQ42508.1 hypothetical protein E2P86_15690 [Sphingobacterium psychroaquaticum]
MSRFYLILLYITGFSFLSTAATDKTWQDCEQITKIALDKIGPMVTKNDYAALEPTLATIEGVCGQNEFTQRLRILRALIERQHTEKLIQDYLDKKYHDVLVMRWDYSVETKYAQIYRENKADFNYVPLNHPIDSLVRLKARALLQSTAFSLRDSEKQIAFLFADDIDSFYQSYEKQTATPQASAIQKIRTNYTDRDRSGFSIYAGIETPLTGSNPVFKSNPVFGFMFSSKISSAVLYELGIRVRINSNDRNFDYLLYGNTEDVNSSASYSFGGTLGYKVFDNYKFILYPKVGLYWESTGTGLSEDTGGDYWGDENYGSNIKYNNVNTMRSSVGFAAMHHLGGKKYIGLEAAYNYVPYNWDNNLLTSIQPNYGSLQVFFRF